MKMTNTGFSLVQTLIALGLVGGLGVAAMKVQEIGARGQSKSNSDQNVELVTTAIQKALSERSTCAYNFRNKSIGQQITSITNATFSPTNYDTIIATGETVVANNVDLDGGIRVINMVLENNGGNDYLSVEFDLDPLKKKKMAGSKNIKKMIPLSLVRTGPIITSCTSETDNLIQTASLETCHALQGTIVNGKCNFIDKYIDLTPKNCGGGASYQMKVVSGKMTMNCVPCPSLIKVYQYSRNEKRVRGSKSQKYCYYYSACSDSPTRLFGNIFSEHC